MFGRHAERRRVLEFLLQDIEGGEPGVAEQGVLPIMASGVGKTTLVQHVCEDPAVRGHSSLAMVLDFHCMSLMAAGETTLLLRSLFTLSATSVLSRDGGGMLRLLEQKLRGERFLAVFDNVDPCGALAHEVAGSSSRLTSTGAKHISGLAMVAEPIKLLPLPREEY
jgi:hypothetical protein